MNYKIIKFPVFGDSRGSLVSFETMKNIPFSIKRVYCIYDTEPDQERGQHAHKELEQVIVCLHGSCTIVLDDGRKRESVEMNHPNVGLYIGKNIWREMKNFSKGCILVVLANEKIFQEKLKSALNSTHFVDLTNAKLKLKEEIEK